MTHNARSADTRQSREKPSTKSASPERDRPSPATERNTHPVLDLQKSAGNRAVQRVLGHFADLSLQNMELQETASEVGFTADGLLNDSTDFIVCRVSAETYDADSATQVTPATATTPTTVDVREPLVIHGSDSQSAQ